jgi:hypothetical protein
MKELVFAIMFGWAHVACVGEMNGSSEQRDEQLLGQTKQEVRRALPTDSRPIARPNVEELRRKVDERRRLYGAPPKNWKDPGQPHSGTHELVPLDTVVEPPQPSARGDEK